MGRINPYTRLQKECRKWASDVLHPMRTMLFRYKDAQKSPGSWRLNDLCERVLAADQLDFDVQLRVEDNALVVEYVKRPEKPPWEISV